MMPVSLSSVIFTVATAQVGEQDSCHEYRVDSQEQVLHVRRRKVQTDKAQPMYTRSGLLLTARHHESLLFKQIFFRVLQVALAVANVNGTMIPMRGFHQNKIEKSCIPFNSSS